MTLLLHLYLKLPSFQASNLCHALSTYAPRKFVRDDLFDLNIYSKVSEKQMNRSSSKMAPSSGETKMILGSLDNFRFWLARTSFDLSHLPTTDSEPIEHVLNLKYEISSVTIDPAKTALAIIDSQNYSLSSALHDDLNLDLFKAEKNLL